MNKIDEDRKILTEWFDGGNISTIQTGAGYPDDEPKQEKEKEPEERKPKDEIGKIEDKAELQKASMLTTALNNKIVALSDVIYSSDKEGDVSNLKEEIKGLLKKVGEIVDGF